MAFIKLYLFIFASSIGYVAISANIQLRNVIHDKSKLWSGNHLYYKVGSNFDDSTGTLIDKTIQRLERVVNVGQACLTFEKTESIEHHYLYFDSSRNEKCRSQYIGQDTAEHRQRIYLTDDCSNKRVIMALLLNALGLYNEYLRPDRDQYIQVHMDNVQDAAKSQFDVIQSQDTDLLGLPYDFHSVTHYGLSQFAINKSLPTITTNVSGVHFDDRDTLSFYDVLKVQKLYGCTEGYAMMGLGFNRFTQTPHESYYPQWRLSSEVLPGYMNTSCDTEGLYSLTVLNGAKWMSRFPLPSGNFCVSVSVCIASSSPDVKSYIQLTTTEGLVLPKLNYTRPVEHWERLNTTYTSDTDWTMLVKAHIMWGGDVLAFKDMIITSGLCQM